MFTPVGKKGSSKYGNNKKVTEDLFRNFKLSEESKKALATVGNFGLARSTWSTYGTAERMLAKCAKSTGRKLELPLNQEDVLEFVGWLIGERNIKAATVNSYLAGIRQMHIMKGIEPPMLRTSLVKFLLKGKANLDNIKARTKNEAKRLPMTMNMMRLLKEEIRRWEADLDLKLLLWAVATMAFHGAFRIHELLCRLESEFDPDFALLGKDVKLKEGADGVLALEVKLKCPKESKSGKVVVVDIFASGGTLCPVKAFTRWQSKTTKTENMPLFRDNKGVPMTGSKINNYLKFLLSKHVDYKKGKFTGHSFRIGLATTLGTLGFSDADVKEAGRWSSNVHEIYMKLPRRRRLAVAEKISKLE
jgi:hypothetical protein